MRRLYYRYIAWLEVRRRPVYHCCRLVWIREFDEVEAYPFWVWGYGPTYGYCLAVIRNTVERTHLGCHYEIESSIEPLTRA